jgi:predicted transposase/invertase (TIGR01784 family)
MGEEIAEKMGKKTKEKSLLLPRYDVTFKSIFKNERNADIVEDFLKATLGLPVDEVLEDIRVMDSELLPRTPDEKLSILDVRLKSPKLGNVNVEIQLYSLPEMKQRLMHYWSTLASSQLKAGENYSQFDKVISIVVANFPFRGSTHYIHRYFLYDPVYKVQFTDLLEFAILDLTKVPEETDHTGAWEWARFFGTDSEKELRMLAKENKKIAKAVMVLEKLSANEQVRQQAEYEEMMRRDYVSRIDGERNEGMAFGEERGIVIGEERGMAIGEERGMVIGEERGIVTTKQGVAKKMLAQGFSPENIADILDLTPDQVIEISGKSCM